MERAFKDGDWIVRKWRDKRALQGSLLHGISYPTLAFLQTLDNAPVHKSMMVFKLYWVYPRAISRN